ncbi:GntR family transcriptional regulator/MocR family aminotransferase [Comamonas sp. BIGb0152]|uniref:MocR-like pyridoxine biosynthesis transcription factor PdxR n=1 Tax=Comamonas sp. BIGb0152 TaxID=2940601 RepID=UPI002168C2A4|nr:PLP-dependent aminotransferase family protein [Comamonas sp. BIGb0152]MCS4292649.1 GntR family transcriptional regulator/MocR family aminotransferase [Comamonas sp. BIGb0152]
MISDTSHTDPLQTLQLPVDRSLQQPMYLQICQRFKTAIAQGHLRAGDRVPAARALATALNLARGTVDLAYRILADEGYFLVRGAAGTVVSPSLPQAALVPPPQALARPPAADIVDHDGLHPRPLQLGLPALDAFPRKVWNRLVTHRLRSSEPYRLAYPNPQGDEELRQRIAAYLAVSRGVTCVPEQVFITTGLRNTLELSLRSLASPSDAFWFEDPGYILARPFLQNAAVQIVPVPVDAQGLQVDAGRQLSPYAKFAMVTPSHQSPLGVTLSLERRMALLDWASEAGSWIIEDDYDSEFRYQGRPLPALKSLDRRDRVIYAGTFSKVLFPGLRLAYTVVPLEVVPRFQAVSSNLNAGCPYLLQASVADFMAQGHFARHLKKMRLLYAERRAMAQRSFQSVLGDRLRIDLQPGGLHLLGQIGDGDNDSLVAQRARVQGLATHPLSRWYIDAAPRQGLLMGFANITSEAQALQLAAQIQQAFG